MKIKHAALAVFTMAVAAAPAATAQTTTVGNSITDRATQDFVAGAAFILDEAFGSAGLTVSSYTFFAEDETEITPLLYLRGADDTFTLSGIGTTRTSTLGINTFDFALTAVNTYFAWRNPGANNVSFDFFLDPGDAGMLFLGAPDLEVGDSNVASAGFRDRTYSINATAVGAVVTPDPSAVPEPATWAIMITGFGMVGASLRRRARAGAIAQTLA